MKKQEAYPVIKFSLINIHDHPFLTITLQLETEIRNLFSSCSYLKYSDKLNEYDDSSLDYYLHRERGRGNNHGKYTLFE